MKRITNFLILEEIDNEQIERNVITGEAVHFDNVSFGWTEDESEVTLKNLKLKVN